MSQPTIPKGGRRPAAKPEPPKPPIPDLELYREAGDTVLWYPGADPTTDPFCGVVTRLGLDFTCTVNRLSPDMCDTSPQEGVRHMNDPKAQQDGSAGGWKHRRITVASRLMLLKEGILEWAYLGGEWQLVIDPAYFDVPDAPAEATSTSLAQA